MSLNPLWSKLFQNNNRHVYQRAGEDHREGIESSTEDISSTIGQSQDAGTSNEPVDANNDENHRNFDIARQQLTDTIIRAIGTNNRRSIYHTGVRRLRDMEDYAGIIDTISKGGKKCIFKWVVKHNDHLHIVHDCVYSNGCCRCFKFLNITRRNSLKSEINSLSREKIGKIIEYHFSGGRQVNLVKVQNASYAYLFDGLEVLRDAGNTAECSGHPGHVEVCESEDEILRDGNEFDGTDEDTETNRQHSTGNPTNKYGPGEKHIRRKRSTKEEKQTQIENMILNILTAPLIDFPATSTWLEF